MYSYTWPTTIKYKHGGKPWIIKALKKHLKITLTGFLLEIKVGRALGYNLLRM